MKVEKKVYRSVLHIRGEDLWPSDKIVGRNESVEIGRKPI